MSKQYGDETRAAVMAALLTGQTVSAVANAYNLDKSTVSRWRSRIDATALQDVATEKGETIETLLLDYVQQNLRTLKAQSIEVGRAKYIQKQSASELAVLHGVLADKTVRILAALEPIEAESERREATSERVN
jgi:transposase-like protein